MDCRVLTFLHDQVLTVWVLCGDVTVFLEAFRLHG